MNANVLNNPVLNTFLFYSCILILKTLTMELFIQWQILKSTIKSQLINQNKYPLINLKTITKIRRIKRAHINDIENIPMFLFAAFIYTCTAPNPMDAIFLYKIFTYARIAHTFVYAVYVIPQPARVITFITGEIIMWYMLVRGITHFWFIK